MLDLMSKSSYYHAKRSHKGGDMIRAGIKEVKNKLSQLLTQVKAGEEVLITERGKPIARLVREKNIERSIRSAIGSLVQKGLVTVPSRSIVKQDLRPVDVPGKLVSKMVIEDRR